jgi:hypothetical protein
MKNIHVLPTDKPSRLIKNNLGYGITPTQFSQTELHFIQAKFQNIYITNSEEIKNGEYGICLNLVRKGFKSNQAVFKMDSEQRQAMEGLGGQKKAEVLKVVLTTDADLIKDGVQAIDDTFLEWFVKNPSCMFIEVESFVNGNVERIYEIIIPKEEAKSVKGGGSIVFPSSTTITFKPKQETLEEAAEKYWSKQPYNEDAFIEGAKWQQERMYSEEDMFEFSQWISHEDWVYLPSKGYWVNEEQEELEQKLSSKEILNMWFEQFKKK